MYTGLLLSCKKEALPFVTTWLNPEGILLSAISRKEKDKNCIMSLTCGIYKTQIHGNRRMVVLRAGGRGKRGSVVRGCRLPGRCKMSPFWGQNVQRGDCS